MITDRKIKNYEQIDKICKRLHKEGKAIVFTTGCFDILHIVHLLYLSYCKSKGEILIVSIGNDKTVSYLKGKNRPVNNEIHRAKLIAGFEPVDYVVISEEFGKLDHAKLIRLIKPSYYIFPANDSAAKEKKDLISAIGGCYLLHHKYRATPRLGRISTTSIENVILKEFIK